MMSKMLQAKKASIGRLVVTREWLAIICDYRAYTLL